MTIAGEKAADMGVASASPSSPPAAWRRAFLLPVVLSACALTGGARGLPPLTVAERAQALDEVIGMRHDRISDRLPVDACSVFLVLDRDPSFRDHLGSYQRARLTADAPASCPATMAEQRMTRDGWYVRSVVRTGRNDMVVTAVQTEALRGGQTERYFLHRGSEGPRRWQLREVRIGDFSYV
ncbi:MAG TPA: hypothetical protein VFJ16_05855 [Longimicrobium sp.]|nr:hypothetical protein [Longimicrobium sp.]